MSCLIQIPAAFQPGWLSSLSSLNHAAGFWTHVSDSCNRAAELQWTCYWSLINLNSGRSSLKCGNCTKKKKKHIIIIAQIVVKLYCNHNFGSFAEHACWQCITPCSNGCTAFQYKQKSSCWLFWSLNRSVQWQENAGVILYFSHCQRMPHKKTKQQQQYCTSVCLSILCYFSTFCSAQLQTTGLYYINL